jgi:hypothetical protein
MTKVIFYRILVDTVTKLLKVFHDLGNVLDVNESEVLVADAPLDIGHMHDLKFVVSNVFAILLLHGHPITAIHV